MSSSFVTLSTVVCQAPLSMGLPRQEYWSGLPLPFPRDLPNSKTEPVSLAGQVESLPRATWEAPYEKITAAAAAKSLQSCPTLRPHRWQPTRLPRPWDSPGKSTGVGCHFLLQCIKVKSESEVPQSCPTLSDPMDCGPPGYSVHGIFQARTLEWVAISFSSA